MADKKKTGIGVKARIMGICALVLAIMFVPSAIMLGIGMIPTVIAATIDRSRSWAKALTVGSMNLAGCTLFLIKLWTEGNKIETSISIISQPQTIVVIYGAAAAGYMIDWALTGLIAGVMVKQGQGRQKEIARQQAELVRRWGPEVTGEIPLDPYGFPIELSDGKKDR